jgi:formylglycine-generating enzyme required for sulfatase activity
MQKMWHKTAGSILLGSVLLLSFFLGASQFGAADEVAVSSIGVLDSEEVFVPAGRFLMGCSPDLYPGGCDTDTYPIHAVYLDAFYIDKTEVTNAQYDACVAAGACRERLHCESKTRPNYCSAPQYANYPVIGVNWGRAVEYCAWVEKRLPTEAEWEKAARGTDMRKYPWGDDPVTCERSNFLSGIWPDYVPCVGDTAPVDSYLNNVSPYGALNMSGNVSEWVNDWYEAHYYYRSPYYNPPGPDITVKQEHLVRGGSWMDNARSVTTLVRLDESEIYKTIRIGIRCARSSTGPPPQPTPEPPPTPAPTPFAANEIGSDGGVVWLASPSNLTMLSVPSGALEARTMITLTSGEQSNLQGDLQGLDQFFTLDVHPPLSESMQGSTTAAAPFELTLGFTSLKGLVPDTVGFYRLGTTGWSTDDIAVSEQTGGHIVAWIGQEGTYGILGRTNRMYLPVFAKVP